MRFDLNNLFDLGNVRSLAISNLILSILILLDLPQLIRKVIALLYELLESGLRLGLWAGFSHVSFRERNPQIQ